MDGGHAFSLDKLAEVPRFVYLKSFMTKLDDKADFWEEELRAMNINVKEMWAVAKSL